MTNFYSALSDDRILRIVRAMDCVSKPLRDRFEGDDDAVVEVMNELGLNQTLADKLLVTGEVLRECAHRGLQIPRPNISVPEDDYSPQIGM